ncbi:MAG TPA: hypothetical protein VHA56_08395 [Mucilaginibacter sp.]|nr:hypothetical protein [Mucilaginibacter sp.]
MNASFNITGANSIHMGYYQIGAARVTKGLLKFLLVLSAALIGHRQPDRASVSESLPRANRNEQLHAARLFQVTGNISEAPVMPAVRQGLHKFPGEGNVKQLAFSFSRICATLFFQNRIAAVYEVRFIQRLLFPAHYFW